MKIINESDIKHEISQIKNKPTKYKIQVDYPYNDLDDRVFEYLIYQIFKSSIGSNKLNINFDNCCLMTGVSEKGKDIILNRKGEFVGVIQCKRHKNNLSKKEFIKELIKFILYILNDNLEQINFSNFTYFIAVSTGLSNTTTDLINKFNVEITNENIEDIVLELNNEYKSLNIPYERLNSKLLSALTNIRVEKLLPTDITNLIGDNPSIVKTFFEISSIIDKKTFEEIINQTNLDVENFCNQYRANVINNYSRLNFFGMALPKKPREVQLYSLFVEPTFKTGGSYSSENIYYTKIQDVDLGSIVGTGKFLFLPRFFLGITEKTTENNNEIPLKSLFNSNQQNIVILGKPGAGKSSLIKYSMCKILDNDISVFENNKIYKKIPFRIELHKYNKFKINKQGGIIEYLLALLDNEYQLPFLNKASLISLFMNYSIIIFFDGLDEILDIKDRSEVRNDIENFVNNYEKVTTVVTSRFESYDEVSFKEKDFNILQINDFNDNQIKEFVNKWYNIEEQNDSVRKNEVSQCIEELKKIEDELKRNPLLLTLILILYRNELELPTSKLDVYEGCTNTIVETRDFKEKKLEFGLKISNKIAIFSSIAYWQYELSINNQTKNITYNDVVNHIKSYLLQKGEFKEENEAKQAAQEFLEFAKIRSIYVENSFTHKTFLEYFAAYYIFANYHTKGKIKERDEIINRYLGKSSWHVILELLICKIDKDQVDYETIDNIIKSQLENHQYNALNFFLNIIKYLSNISSDIINKLIEDGFKLCTDNNSSQNRIIKSINNHLISLSKYPRFEVSIKMKINEISKDVKTETEIKNFALFLLENFINSPHLVDILSNKEYRTILEKDPYIFILVNYSKIMTENEFPHMIKSFIKKFGKNKALKSYITRFGHGIFLGSNRFSWVITPLFSKYDYEFFFNNAKSLVSCLGTIVILNQIKNEKGKINISKEQLESYLNQETDVAIKSIINVALEKYYNVKKETNKNQVFFDKRKNPNKRFQVPK